MEPLFIASISVISALVSIPLIAGIVMIVSKLKEHTKIQASHKKAIDNYKQKTAETKK